MCIIFYVMFYVMCLFTVFSDVKLAFIIILKINFKKNLFPLLTLFYLTFLEIIISQK